MIETAGLKCAPLMGPKSAINVARTATVAAVFASSATARFPPASRSAMIPEPITVAAKRSEPKPSARSARWSTLSGLGCRAALSDLSELRLQSHSVEGVDGKAGKELDPSFKFLEGFAERERVLRF